MTASSTVPYVVVCGETESKGIKPVSSSLSESSTQSDRSSSRPPEDEVEDEEHTEAFPGLEEEPVVVVVVVSMAESVCLAPFSVRFCACICGPFPQRYWPNLSCYAFSAGLNTSSVCIDTCRRRERGDAGAVVYTDGGKGKLLHPVRTHRHSQARCPRLAC